MTEVFVADHRLEQPANTYKRILGNFDFSENFITHSQFILDGVRRGQALIPTAAHGSEFKPQHENTL